MKEIDEDKAHDLHGKVFPQVEGDYGGRIGTIIIQNRLDGYDDPNCTVRVGRKAPMTVMDVLADMCKSTDTSAFKRIVGNQASVKQGISRLGRLLAKHDRALYMIHRAYLPQL